MPMTKNSVHYIKVVENTYKEAERLAIKKTSTWLIKWQVVYQQKSGSRLLTSTITFNM